METLEMREARLRNAINERKVQIADGVSAESRDRMEKEIAEFEEGLKAMTVEQAHAERVTASKTEFSYVLDTLVSNGLTMRQMCGTDSQYNLLRLSVEDAFAEQAEISSKKITDLETANKALQGELQGASERESQLQRQNGELQRVIVGYKEEEQVTKEEHSNFAIELKTQILQSQLETKHANSQRDAAVNAAEEMKAELDKLRNPQPVMGTEEQERLKQAAADKVKIERTITNVEPVEAINPKHFTATVVATGEKITFNWTTTNSWIILTDQNEVEQFRQAHAILPIITMDLGQIATLDLQIPSIAGNDFRSEEIPSGLDSASAGTDQGVQASEGEVTLESLHERVKALEAKVAA